MFGFSRQQEGILHLTWTAFFLTFAAWFNMAPFNATLRMNMALSSEQINILMICNVALTMPARIAIGSLVDLYGPRKVYSFILFFAGAVCLQFALANSYLDLVISRLLMSIVGAGFVVGIKMIGEWFPSEKMGIAQGIYGGWGNFGAAAASFSLPMIAAFFSPESGWRIASLFSGILCLIWAGVYFYFTQNSPSKKNTFKAPLDSRMEVTSKKDLILLILIQFPIYGATAALAWRLSIHPHALFSSLITLLLYVSIFGSFIWNACSLVSFNLKHLSKSSSTKKHYEFQQIAILSLIYSLTFGSQLAVISMFPQLLETLYGLTTVQAGWFGSSFAFMNLVTRPGGGWFSDKVGRKRSILILTTGVMLSYGLMTQIGPKWPLAGTMAAAILSSIFLQAGNGACFAIVPLIRKDLTGKLAGLVGAYGNFGAVVFLIVFSFVDTKLFFTILASYSALILAVSAILRPFTMDSENRGDN